MEERARYLGRNNAKTFHSFVDGRACMREKGRGILEEEEENQTGGNENKKEKKKE